MGLVGKDFNLEVKKKVLNIYYQDNLLLKVSRVGLTSLLCNLSIKDGIDTKRLAKKKKKVKNLVTVKSRISVAKKLMKQYCKSKSNFYNGRKVSEIKETNASYKHFLKAADIIIEQKVSLKVFVKSQVSGLNFINNGAGKFPAVNQLGTEGAETRLLEYLRDGEINDDPTERIELSWKEKETPLKSNRKYNKFMKNLNLDKTNLRELYYIADCQKVRNGFTHPDIQDTIAEY